MIKRLSHVCLGSPDLDRTMAFYCGMLGCQVVHEFRNERSELYGVLLLVNNGTFLEFFKDEAASAQGGFFRHLCFEVDDIEQVVQRVRRHGFSAEVIRGRTDRVLQCWITDPDGNKVEFHQYDEQAVQFKYCEAHGA